MMSSVNGKMIIDALAENVLKTRFEDIDPDIVENTKKRLLDVIGCTIGGAKAAGNDGLIDLVKSWGGNQEATILGYGVRTAAPDAAWANAILCRSFDWEPLVAIIGQKRYPGHVSGTTVSTALIMAETVGCSGRELITALVAGDDIAERVYAAAGEPWKRSEDNSQLRRGPTFDAWGTMPAFGATAIAGRLLGLNKMQLKNAFGIVVNMISGGGGGLADGSTTFKLSQGTSARSGVVAAQLAKAGWTGISDPLFAKNGYYITFNQGCEYPEILTSDLGKKYYVELVFKPYPGGRPTHTAIDAALAVVRKNEFDTRDISKIVLHLSPPMRYAHYMKPYKVGDYPTGDALFSYKYSTATALVRKKVTSENYIESSIRDPEVQSVIGKIELASDLAREEGLELEVILKNGRAFSQYVCEGTGELPNPLSWDALTAKFRFQEEFSRNVSPGNAGKIVELLRQLESIDDIKGLIKMACKTG
jgi:2-methylcitrate dehydratase PrpD